MRIPVTVSAACIAGFCLVMGVSMSTAREKDFYVGDGACLAHCHGVQVTSFKENIHNKAFTVIRDSERYLKLKEEGKAASCLKCHVTGYGEPGGFTDEEATPDHARVGCEGCHGPGSGHIAAQADDKAEKKSSIKRKPDCGKCHQIHSHTG